MKARRGGFMLVLSLLAIALMLVLGLGMLGSQAAKYRAVARSREASQAKALAIAGLEDARVKLDLDIEFPPKEGLGQSVFSYSEDLTGTLGSGVPMSYAVVVDTSDQEAPIGVIKITSIGVVGPRDAPLAQRVIHAELDSAKDKRTGSGANPNYWNYIRWEDEGGL